MQRSQVHWATALSTKAITNQAHALIQGTRQHNKKDIAVFTACTTENTFSNTLINSMTQNQHIQRQLTVM